MENSSKVVARLPKKKLLTKERLFILCSLAPTLIMLSGWTFYPTLHSFVLSFFDTTMDSLGEFEGLRNYVAVLTNETFWVALRNTALFSLESIAGAVTSGLLLAVLLNTRMSGKRLFRTAFFLPYVIPHAAHSILWMWLYDPRYGLWNYLLGFVGLGPIPWVKSSAWVLHAFVIMNIWKRTGFTMVLFTAGLQTIPADLYEAATIDGAGPWRRFWRITLPMLKPVMLFQIVMTFAGTFQLFIEPFVMTKGGPGNASLSVVYMIYSMGFGEYDQGGASAIAVILFLIIFPATLLLIRAFDNRDTQY